MGTFSQFATLAGKVLVTLLILFPYSFGVGWLLSMSEVGSSEALQGASRVAFFISAITGLVGMWLCTWVKEARRWAFRLLIAAFFVSLLFAALGYPRSMGVLAFASPLILLSAGYVFWLWRTKQAT